MGLMPELGNMSRDVLEEAWKLNGRLYYFVSVERTISPILCEALHCCAANYNTSATVSSALSSKQERPLNTLQAHKAKQQPSTTHLET